MALWKPHGCIFQSSVSKLETWWRPAASLAKTVTKLQLQKWSRKRREYTDCDRKVCRGKRAALTSFGMRSSCDAVWVLDSMPAEKGERYEVSKAQENSIVFCSSKWFPLSFVPIAHYFNLTWNWYIGLLKCSGWNMMDASPSHFCLMRWKKNPPTVRPSFEVHCECDVFVFIFKVFCWRNLPQGPYRVGNVRYFSLYKEPSIISEFRLDWLVKAYYIRNSVNNTDRQTDFLKIIS